MDRAEKREVVTALHDVFAKTGVVVVAHYAGLTVAQMTKLRSEMRSAGGRVKVAKNKVAPPFRECEFDIMYGEGISREGDVLDLAVAQNVVDKSGAWFSYKGDRLGQGRENSKATLKEKPEILKRIEREVKVKLGMPVREEKVEAAAPTAKAATAEKK